MSESFGDLNLKDAHNDEFLDLSREIEPIKFQKVHLVREKVVTTERITNGMEKYDQQNQDIKNKDLLEQDFGKFFPDREEHFSDAENVFDRKLKRNLEDCVLFRWCGRWCFDPVVATRAPCTRDAKTGFRECREQGSGGYRDEQEREGKHYGTGILEDDRWWI
jgi:hypothetical protein